MHQILHIVRKDCRRFFPEISLSLAMVAAFIWLAPNMWLASNPPRMEHLWLDLDRLQKLAQIITVLLPVSWFILITRVVQDENLIGNRQFWVTRPYDWKKLLGAKLLFIVTFILLPFLASQMLIMLREEFHPLLYIPGLLFNLLLITGAAILPFFCLAVVTSSLLRIIGTLLVIAAVVAAMAFFWPHEGYQSPNSAYLPISDRMTLPLVYAFSGAITPH